MFLRLLWELPQAAAADSCSPRTPVQHLPTSPTSPTPLLPTLPTLPHLPTSPPHPAPQAVSSLGGVAAEHVAQLANLLGADVWLAAHHTAANDTVAAAAGLLAARLRPDVAVYVEHSNEVRRGGRGGGRRRGAWGFVTS